MDNQYGRISQLELTAVEKEGKTILSDVSFTAPFKIMHPFYEKKDRMTVMVQTASAGILAGDRQELKVRVRTGARMELLSQSYEKIYKMQEGFAQRRTAICVESGACLYYTPLPVIPFAGSDFRAETQADLADASARFVYSEILSCGRAAHGECFLYSRFQNRLTIRRGRSVIYLDHMQFEPETMAMQGFGLYEGFTHLANMILCGDPKPDDWLHAARERIDKAEGMEGGVTRTAFGDTAVRILGVSGQKLTGMLKELQQM